MICQKTQSNEQKKNKIASIKFEILRIVPIIFKGSKISPERKGKMILYIKIVISI
jgi:hypothetical protein